MGASCAAKCCHHGTAESGDGAAEIASANSEETQCVFEYLSATPFFLHLDEAMLRTLARHFNVSAYPQDAVIVSQGEALSTFYIIGEGTVTFSIANTNASPPNGFVRTRCSLPGIIEAQNRASHIDLPQSLERARENAKQIRRQSSMVDSSKQAVDDGANANPITERVTCASGSGSGVEDVPPAAKSTAELPVALPLDCADTPPAPDAAFMRSGPPQSEERSPRVPRVSQISLTSDVARSPLTAPQRTPQPHLPQPPVCPPLLSPVEFGYRRPSRKLLRPGAALAATFAAADRCVPVSSPTASGLPQSDSLPSEHSSGAFSVVPVEKCESTRRTSSPLSANCGRAADKAVSNLSQKKAGSFFGHVGFFQEGSRYPNTVIASSSICICIHVRRATLLQLMKERPDMAAAIQIAMGDSFEKQLCNLPLFRGLTDDKAALLATLFHYVPILTNEILFEEGDLEEEGNSMFIVYKGSCKAIAFQGTQEVLLNEFYRGDFFGEIGLLMDIPRTATVVAKEKCIFLELCRNDFQTFVALNLSEQLEENISSIMKIRIAEHFRKYKLSLFKAIPDEKYAILAQLCEIEQVPAGVVIFHENDVGRSFYLIVHGSVKVSCRRPIKDHEEDIELCELYPGAYFGETSLLRDTTRNATVTTTSRCVLASIDHENAHRLFELIPEALADFELRLSTYDVSLMFILHHSIALAYFEMHLRREFSLENLLFWKAVNEFRQRFFHLKNNHHLVLSRAHPVIANPSLDLPSSSVSIDDDAPPPTPPAGAGDAAEEDEPPVITPRLLRTVTAFATLPEKSAQHSYEQSDPSRPLSFDLRKNSGNLEHRVFKRRDSDLAEAASSPVPECSSRTAGAIAGTHGFGSSPVANSVVAARLGWASVKQSLFRSRKDSEKNAHVEMANMLKEFNVIMSTYIETNASMQVNLMGLTRLELSQISPGFLDASAFDAAQDEIFRLMETDSFPRFKQSELFQEFLDTLGPTSALRPSSNSDFTLRKSSLGTKIAQTRSSLAEPSSQKLSTGATSSAGLDASPKPPPRLRQTPTSESEPAAAAILTRGRKSPSERVSLGSFPNMAKGPLPQSPDNETLNITRSTFGVSFAPGAAPYSKSSRAARKTNRDANLTLPPVAPKVFSDNSAAFFSSSNATPGNAPAPPAPSGAEALRRSLHAARSDGNGSESSRPLTVTAAADFSNAQASPLSIFAASSSSPGISSPYRDASAADNAHSSQTQRSSASDASAGAQEDRVDSSQDSFLCPAETECRLPSCAVQIPGSVMDGEDKGTKSVMVPETGDTPSTSDTGTGAGASEGDVDGDGAAREAGSRNTLLELSMKSPARLDLPNPIAEVGVSIKADSVPMPPFDRRSSECEFPNGDDADSAAIIRRQNQRRDTMASISRISNRRSQSKNSPN